MNQELKNFDLLIIELEGTYRNGDYQAFKTLLNIYNTMYEKFLSSYFKYPHLSGEGEMLIRHNKILKSFEKDLLKKDFSKAVSNSSYKTLHTIQYLIDSLKELNYYMNKKLEKYEASKVINECFNKGIDDLIKRNKAKNLLDKSIEGGFLITQVTEDLRGTGKTESLINKAHELDVTLIVGTHRTKQIADEKAHEMRIDIDCKYANNINALRGYKFKNNKFLVDDSVPNLLIRELINQGKEFVGGFNSLNDSLSTLKQPALLEHLHTKLNKLINERNVLNAVYLDDAPNISAWLIVNKKIDLINEMIHEEKLNILGNS